jgi:urate oxidase
MTVNSNVYLKHARYGKDLVRLLRVYKEGDVQHCTELTVSCMIRWDVFMLISN